ncbi:MAG TPA: hypothetical protein VFY75_03365 [Solirubrobacterales bacterium]|nr:hypothetical protein [Solirubrobacterales bacterium]
MRRPTSSLAHRRGFRLALALVPALLFATFAFANAGSAAPAGSANLKITKTDSPDPVRVGAGLTYAIGVENLGPSPASGVTVTDNLPKGVDLVSASGPSGACAVQGGKVTCGVGSLDPVGVNYGGVPATVTIVVVPRKPGTIRNTATVKGDQKDPVGANNKATATTRVLGAPSCRGFTATVTGTSGDDVLLGTAGPDVIVALAGNDRIVSRAGRDLICAGRGADYVGAGSAADRVLGGGGPDRLLGRGGPDVLKGSGGNDVLKGGRGSDRLRGGRGFDRCSPGPGLDSVRGCER